MTGFSTVCVLRKKKRPGRSPDALGIQLGITAVTVSLSSVRSVVTI